ncbi:PREDICTED: girdin [Rhagoletis zephyria]|uniref:girdin n=1 Tax=Rhagoletis zephyria TaxID=28612 RepID=UPI00081175FE|nr:PREDICTED: girdin [Rhagoletis zephyria]
MAEQQRRTTNEHILRTQLDALTAQNTRLQEENNLLRQKLTRITGDHRSTAAINVEAKIEALRLEDERDQMYDNLERLKKKYNKLHAAYLEKVQRCKALEDTFKRQKTLSGLVSKTALNQRVQELAAKTETVNLEKQVAKLQTALDEAYDIIDELEFELESIDYLEQENQRMRNELFSLKSNRPAILQPAENLAINAVPPPDYDDPPPSYDADVADGASGMIRNALRLSNASSSNESLPHDDADSETLERAAMTHTLIENAAVESSQLRRELLKCRLQNTCRPK